MEPRPLKNSPEVEVSRIRSNGSGWLEASFTCYSYDTWIHPNKQDGNDQSFIWATNTNAPIHGSSPNAHLEVHEYYGHFHLDMKEAQSHAEKPSYPEIDFTRKNSNVSNAHGGDSAKSWQRLRSWHGYLLTLATTILFPTGAILIRSRLMDAFQLHLLVQASASIICLVGTALGFYGMTRSRWVCDPFPV